jgi:hypothetical protein
LRNALKAGDVFGEDSTEFRRFEDDLISDARWQHKDVVLKDIGAPVLLTPIERTLAAFRDAIEEKFKLVNQPIESGDNQHVKVSRRNDQDRWTLLYSDADETVNGSFYGQLPGIGVADLLWFVAGRTGFLRAFTHVLDRYVKHDADPREILACVVAMGYGHQHGPEQNGGGLRTQPCVDVNDGAQLSASRNAPCCERRD